MTTDCDVLAVDADVVLLFGVERFAAGGFGDFNVLRTADPVGGMETPVAIGGEVEEGGRQNNCEDKSTQESHRGYSLKACSLNSSEKVGFTAEDATRVYNRDSGRTQA